jgi:hypothetical protein
VDEDFILDRFNLTGLNNDVSNYPQALDLITDNLGAEQCFKFLIGHVTHAGYQMMICKMNYEDPWMFKRVCCTD